jgi:hypothetical protein
MFGYVFIDGQAVAGAKVTITSSQDTEELWTEEGPDSTQPYYRTSLSTAPLSAQAGQTITITAEYSGHTRSITHTVLGGGQQVDVVLPRNAASDYVFDRQIWKQGAVGTVIGPHDIAVDSVSNIYVLDSGNARIQVFNKDYKFLYQWGTLGSAPGQFSGSMRGIAVGKNGSVYVADTGNNRIQKFTNTGAFVLTWGSRGSGDGQFNAPQGIAVNNNGDIYIADSNNNRIQKFSGDGEWQTGWGSLGSLDRQFISPGGLTIDHNGNVYVTDTENHRIQEFTGNGTWLTTWGNYGNADGQLFRPTGIAIDSANNIYVADTWNYRVQKFGNDGSWQATIGGFFLPRGIALDSDDNLLVADWGNNRLQKFNNNGDLITTWAEGRSENGQMRDPTEVTVDSIGNVFVTDTYNHRIQKYSNTGGWLASWGGVGSGDGQMIFPTGIAIDHNNDVYVSDTYNHRVQKFTSNGVFLKSWGSAGSNTGQFSFPNGIGIDRSNNIYVADAVNDRVQKFTSEGIWLQSWGSTGSGIGQFRDPHGVGIDSKGNMYVADNVNNRVQKLSSAGTPLFSWGVFGSDIGQLNSPQAIFVDNNDNVFVADTGNQRYQKFRSNGDWLGSWGLPGSGAGQLVSPEGIAVDGSGNVYVVDSGNNDSGNNRVEIFRPMTYTRPIATIVATGARSLAQGQPFEAIGTGSDGDTTPGLAGYEWTLDGSATPFATTASASLPTSGVSPGQHTISFRVRDTEGEYSDPQSITINISTDLTKLETWTFLLYLDGDAPNTAPFLNLDSTYGALYRLTHTAPNPNVTIVALYDGPLLGGGDSFRYIIRPDGSTAQEYRGEVNMGDPQTLSDFVAWGMQQAPASHYYLALADHANALDGIAWDFTSGKNERLTNGEIRQALVTITENGAHPIDVLHFDGCLMGLVENAYQIRGLARYLVASENLGWSAFAYDSYRAQIGAQTDPAALATAVADQYAAKLAAEAYPYTISVLNLAQVDAVERTTDALARELLRYALISPANRAALSSLRGQVQKFDSGGNFAITNDDEYVDLAGWAEAVQANIGDSGVQGAAAALRNALPGLVVREHHASGSLEQATGAPDQYTLDGAHGLGIYYPPRASVKTYQTYVQGELNFATDTHWKDYLAAGLTALPFDPSDPEVNPVAPLPLGLTNRTYVSILLR